jgi:hypothetical protein
MTTERNNRRQDLRFQRISSTYESRKQQIVSLFRRAQVAHLSHRELLTRREAMGLNKGLPLWAVHKLEGAWEACVAMLYLDFVFCYPHPETGVITPATELCDAGLASALTDKGLDKQGNHYYKNANGTFTDAF